VASIVLFSELPAETISFYRALGVPLADEDHGDGIAHAAAAVGGVHSAVFPSELAGTPPAWRAGGSTFVGFWVSSLETAMAALLPLGAEVLVTHECREWGCRVVLSDPDGRAVEINQRDHCADPA
jgi:catechol 2,3-dioxygenase-like lactoylglutathione lyase family enzyme